MLLAIETSTRTGSVARVERSGEIEEIQLGAQQDHGASLARTVARLVDDLTKVQAYGISVGPGSFTGLRIGISFLKGLAVVHPKPAVCVSTLEVMATRLAEVHADAERFLPLIDARKGEVFAALYRRGDDGVVSDPTLPEGLHALDALPVVEGVIAAGDVTIPAWARSDPRNAVPKASVLGRIALSRYLSGQGVDPLQVEPVYHQLSAAEVTLGIRAKLL